MVKSLKCSFRNSTWSWRGCSFYSSQRLAIYCFPSSNSAFKVEDWALQDVSVSTATESAGHLLHYNRKTYVRPGNSAWFFRMSISGAWQEDPWISLDPQGYPTFLKISADIFARKPLASVLFHNAVQFQEVMSSPVSTVLNTPLGRRECMERDSLPVWGVRYSGEWPHLPPLPTQTYLLLNYAGLTLKAQGRWAYWEPEKRRNHSG